MSNEARKTEPDCKEIAKNIDAMDERQLRRYCRLIEMIGQQQMDSIRHKNDVIAKLTADNQKLEQQLTIAKDNERMLDNQVREMAATERSCTEDINRLLVEHGLDPIKKDQLGICTESALDALKRFYDSVYSDRVSLDNEKFAFEYDRHRDYQEHKATMFALVTFGILMITCIVCIVSMAVL